MPYQLFVEIGRVVLIESGRNAGKIAVIINVIDQNRVLIEGPTSGVKRMVGFFVLEIPSLMSIVLGCITTSVLG